MSPRIQRLITLLIVLYITFIGGTAYAHTGEIPDIIRLIVFAGPVAVWLTGLIRAGRRLPRTALDLPLAVYVGWLFFTALFALDRRISLEMIWPFLVHVLGFYLLVDLMRRGWARHFQIALLAVALVIVLISGIELAAWYFGWLGQAGWFPAGGWSDPVPPTLPHLDAALNITTIQGNYLAVLIPLVITGALAVKRRGTRIGLAGLALALLLINVLTFSRGGLLGALVSMGLLCAFGALRWGQQTGRLAALLQPRIILAAALVAVIGSGLFIVVWTSGASRSDSDQGRLDTWQSALDMARDHPLTGVGPGLFGLALRSYRDPEIAQDKIVSAHNLFLNTLAETGLPGLLILLWTAAVFGRAWWQRWQSAPPDHRLWLEGALAAFVAFGVHSLVDTFPLTSSVLPLLILAAYTAQEPEPEPVPADTVIPRWCCLPVWVALVGIVIYGWWIVRLDVAQFWMTLSRDAAANNDLDTALERAQHARDLDGDLSLYALHEAYVLGLLAEQSPDIYLSSAIEAHETALDKQPTFDLGWANLSALYEQRGDSEFARRAMQRAAAINPSNAVYWFKLGDYTRALEEDPDLTRAVATLDPDDLIPFVSENAIPVAERLYVAVWGNLDDTAAGLVPQVKQENGWFAHLALGLYEHYVTGDDDAALKWLSKAINERPADERAALLRAEIHLARGDLDAAERDARAALFADPYGGAPANLILAQVERQRGASNAHIQELIKASASSRPAIQYFAGTVYARPASFDYLPQLNAPRTQIVLRQVTGIVQTTTPD
ncbi:MAG: O-antigen ligase family protein [Anaerolineae bacterium]|nr:O-antigen ligase family protein [Anaerolineae bacterium]